MATAKAQNTDLTDDKLDQLILSEYPYPIAVNYHRLLEAQGWEARTRKCIEVFEYGLRAITLGVLSQYLIRDVHQVSDVELDRKLYRKLPEASVGQWVEFFFLALRAYRGQRKRFFMPELYDLYWDTSQDPHQRRKGVRQPFNRLVQIRNDLAHRLAPESEDEWEVLGREALGHLRTILGWFSFLQHYDLIRIVKQHNDEHEYERYTGQEITTHRQHLHGREEELREGWFYLSRQDRSVLRLHPLLVFFVDEAQAAVGGQKQRDAAVYERLLKEAVEYVATVVRQVVEERDAELIAQFRELIYYNIEHIKLARKRTVLSWTGLRQAAAELSAAQMGTVREKYQRELYLQRDQIFRAFQEFLASDKGCFVLTGKSGVGKSNFVLSLADEYAEREDVCLLMYNGARLTVPETMVRTITEDLARYLTLEGEAAENLFAELDRQGEMAGKILIVVFDAINENVDGKVLLRQIDQMVGQERYPWLKVMVTSRPQAWRALKRGLRLAEERYYRERGSDEYWVELQEFTVKLEPFEREELPEVYEKYRQAYGLQTEYEALRPALWSALRDPLVLRLVAEVYRDQAIPERIRTSDIYDQYVRTLLRTERLYEGDIILLERELMPLMITEGHYDNKLTASQIHSAETRDGRPLWELLRSDDMLSNGRQINASYLRLVDAEILTELGSGLDYTIGFKYERFYEFFGGRQLQRIGRAAIDEVKSYEDVISTLTSNLFLWGVLVQALTLELAAGNQTLIVKLIPKSKEDRLLRSAMVAALTNYGEADLDRATTFIWKLLGSLTPMPRTFVGELWRLLRPIKEEPTDLPIRQIIAIESSAHLKMTDLLEEVAANPAPKLRALGAQHTFYLWKQDQAAGFQILDGLGRRVTGRSGLPNLSVAESILMVSGAILGQETLNKQVLARLLVTGRRAVRRVLLLGDVENPHSRSERLRQAVGSFLRRQVLSSLLGFVIRLVRTWKGHTISLENLGHVFDLSREQKALVRTLIPFMDPDEEGLTEHLEDMIQTLDWGDMVAEAVVGHALLSHGAVNFDTTMPMLRKITVSGLSQSPPRFWVVGLSWISLQIALRQDYPSLELWDLIEKAAAAIQEDPDRWLALARQERPVPVRSNCRASGLAPLTGAAYVFQSNVETNLLTECLERAMKIRDDEYLRLYVTNEIPMIFETGQLGAALQALQPIATYESPEVRDEVVAFLVRARRYHPEAVEDYLLQGQFPHEVVARVLAYPPSERLTDLMSWQLTSIMYDLFLLGPKLLRREFQWLNLQMLELARVEDWLTLVIKEMINLLAGELVFNVPKDAPSRQLLLASQDSEPQLRMRF
jgi:hypothetical protein